ALFFATSQKRRQHAQANSRLFRLLMRSPRNAHILSTSALLSCHSASVMVIASALAPVVCREEGRQSSNPPCAGGCRRDNAREPPHRHTRPPPKEARIGMAAKSPCS